MTDMNQVALGGRITKDVVLENIKDTTIAKVSIAVNNSRWDSKTQQSVDEVTFVDFSIFGDYAKNMVKYFKKGTYITAEGRLKMDRWTSEDGKTHQQLKFVPEQGKINPWVGGKKDDKEPQNQIPEQVVEEFDNPENYGYGN